MKDIGRRFLVADEAFLLIIREWLLYNWKMLLILIKHIFSRMALQNFFARYAFTEIAYCCKTCLLKRHFTRRAILIWHYIIAHFLDTFPAITFKYIIAVIAFQPGYKKLVCFHRMPNITTRYYFYHDDRFSSPHPLTTGLIARWLKLPFAVATWITLVAWNLFTLLFRFQEINGAALRLYYLSFTISI